MLQQIKNIRPKWRRQRLTEYNETIIEPTDRFGSASCGSKIKRREKKKKLVFCSSASHLMCHRDHIKGSGLSPPSPPCRTPHADMISPPPFFFSPFIHGYQWFKSPAKQAYSTVLYSLSFFDILEPSSRSTALSLTLLIYLCHVIFISSPRVSYSSISHQIQAKKKSTLCKNLNRTAKRKIIRRWSHSRAVKTLWIVAF